MCMQTRLKGGPISEEGYRRRDADGSGRDDRAPEEVANDWGGREDAESRLKIGAPNPKV